MNYWHIARVPADGVPGGTYHLHQLDPVALDKAADALLDADPVLDKATAYAEVLGDEAERIRTELGFPPKSRWQSRPGWQSSISTGEPHPSLIAAAGPNVHRSDGAP